MATERLRYVNTASVGGDGTTNNTSGATAAYATWVAMEAAEQDNFVTADEWLHVMFEGSADDTTLVLMDGSTLDATHYMLMEGDCNGVWDDDNYSLVVDTATPVWLNDPYIHLDKMQVRSTKASPGGNDCAIFVAQDGCTIDRSLFRGGRWTLRMGTTGVLKIMRTAAYGGGGGGGGLIDFAVGTIEAQDCIFQGDTYGVRNFSSSTYTMRNCYAEGNDTFAYSGTIGKTTCASSDATGSAGLQNIAYDSLTFANVTSGLEDFTIVTDSPLIDVGTNNSGESSPFDYTVDAAGVTITQPQDIGSIQLGAAPGPIISSITDPAITATALTIAGVNFEAAQGTGAVTQEQGAVVVNLTETAWADDEITATSADVELTSLKYGTTTIKVVNDASAEGTNTFEATPLAGSNYVDLVSIAVSAERITASTDLIIGDQLRYEAFLHQEGSPTGYTIVVNDDASFSVDGDTPLGSYTFKVRAWNSLDSTWGSDINQVVNIT